MKMFSKIFLARKEKKKGRRGKDRQDAGGRERSLPTRSGLFALPKVCVF